MKALVEQLLFLARGDNDSVRFQPQLCDLTEVAAEVLRETEMLDQTHRFEGKWLCAVPVVADEALLKQALRILVDNQVDYSKNRNMVLTSVVFVVGLSGVTLSLGNVALSGMTLAAIVAMVMSLLFFAFDKLHWSNDQVE